MSIYEPKDLVIAKASLRSDSFVSQDQLNITQPFCNLTLSLDGYLSSLPTFRQVHVLRFITDRPSIGTAGSFIYSSDDSFLSNMDIETAVWGAPGMDSFRPGHYSQFKTWLTQRKQRGKPIQRLQINRSAGNHIRIPSLQAFKAEVESLQLVHTVQWV
jgi:hypothetical protein